MAAAVKAASFVLRARSGDAPWSELCRRNRRPRLMPRTLQGGKSRVGVRRLARRRSGDHRGPSATPRPRSAGGGLAWESPDRAIDESDAGCSSRRTRPAPAGHRASLRLLRGSVAFEWDAEDQQVGDGSHARPSQSHANATLPESSLATNTNSILATWPNEE